MLYDQIYTLSESMNDKVHSIMNGRIFRAYKEAGDCLRFVDAITGETLVNSTPVVSSIERGDGITLIITRSGTTYLLRKLSSVLPTTKPEVKYPLIKKDEVDLDSFHVLEKTNDVKHINYGDGYIKWTFKFDRPISQKEFEAFCKKNGYELKPKGAWYEDYNKIEGIGDTWTWIKVLVYTD